MVKTGHTPGPWRAELSETSDGAEFWSIYAADGSAVGYMTLDCDGALAANARLTAAAPEMLGILREILSEAVWASYPDAYWKVKQASMERLRAAITKAEGQP